METTGHPAHYDTGHSGLDKTSAFYSSASDNHTLSICRLIVGSSEKREENEEWISKTNFRIRRNGITKYEEDRNDREGLSYISSEWEEDEYKDERKEASRSTCTVIFRRVGISSATN